MSPAPFEAIPAHLDDGVSVVAIRGELDLSTAPDLERLLEEVVARGDSQVLIDLSDCEFIDSTGIALIVRAWQRLDRDAGEGSGRLVVCSRNEQVRRVLDVTGLELSIQIHAGRDEALASLRG